jgi:hypothetical protein
MKTPKTLIAKNFALMVCSSLNKKIKFYDFPNTGHLRRSFPLLRRVARRTPLYCDSAIAMPAMARCIGGAVP